jgi:hypothetical protein
MSLRLKSDTQETKRLAALGASVEEISGAECFGPNTKEAWRVNRWPHLLMRRSFSSSPWRSFGD